MPRQRHEKRGWTVMQSVSRKKLERMWIFIFIAPTVLVFLALYLWPLMLALFSSFTQWNGFTTMKFIGFGNYIELFNDSNFQQATLNTLYSALLGTFVHVPVGVVLALVLSRKPRGWRFVRSAYMLPNIVSGAGMALLFIFIYKQAYFFEYSIEVFQLSFYNILFIP
jgi:raffinose/stachyose/melibiose transport system permease protein